jgi:hypothetical protein
MTFGAAFALPLAFGDLDLGPLVMGCPCGFGKAACGITASLNSSAMGLLLDLTRLAWTRESGGGDGEFTVYLRVRALELLLALVVVVVLLLRRRLLPCPPS